MLRATSDGDTPVRNGSCDESVGDNRERNVYVGRVIKSHGLRGEVRVFMDTAIAALIHDGMNVSAEYDDGASRCLEIESIKVRVGAVFVKFKDIGDRSAADGLKGCMISVPADIVDSRGGERYYAHEFEGMTVYDRDDSKIGTILRVDSYPANEVFIVDTGETELWIPAVRDFILEVDKAGKRIVTTRTGELPFYPKGGIIK